jgi:uncharacterized protein
MKSILKQISFASAIVFILLFIFSAVAMSPVSTPEPRVITTSGDADVKVKPDEVILTFGVETRNKDLQTVKKENDDRVKKVLALAKEFEIDPKYIQTDYINIGPEYDINHNLTGYVARKNIVFTLKDTGKFEDLLTRSLEVGANYMHGVQFRTTELRKYRDQARALAIKAAKEKADALAKELGQKVGQPRNIQEGYNGWYSPYNSGWWGSRGYGGMAQNVVQNVGGGSSETEGTIALGMITVNAKITVTFELAD